MRRPALRVDATEASAAVADLGVILPLVATLAVVNGLPAGPALTFVGALFLVAGIAYRVPTPVQPVKAAAAIVIATGAGAELLSAAGLLLGAILLALAATGTIRLVARLFPKPVIRGNQLGVGLLLVLASLSLAGSRSGWDPAPLFVAALALLGLVLASRRRAALAVAMLAGGVAWSLARGAGLDLEPSLQLPQLAVPSAHDLAVAFTVLVVPQLPLTLGNAVVGTADLQREYYGARASATTARRLCVTAGGANVVAGLFGGMPMCHGSSGATAYRRFGARTGGVNLVLGWGFLAAGLAFPATALSAFALVPLPVLAALLAYTGIRHAMLAADLRGMDLAVAGAMGVVGGVTRNLMVATLVGISLHGLLAVARRRRRVTGAA